MEKNLFIISGVLKGICVYLFLFYSVEGKGLRFDFTFIFWVYFLCADTSFFLVLKFILSSEGEFESVLYSYIGWLAVFFFFFV